MIHTPTQTPRHMKVETTTTLYRTLYSTSKVYAGLMCPEAEKPLDKKVQCN